MVARVVSHFEIIEVVVYVRERAIDAFRRALEGGYSATREVCGHPDVADVGAGETGAPTTYDILVENPAIPLPRVQTQVEAGDCGSGRSGARPSPSRPTIPS